jgi:hypothetical protein
MDDVLASRARRALELGRLRAALFGAIGVTFALLLVSLAAPSPLDARWLVLPFVTWTFVAWCGGSLARGGVLGLVAGTVGWLVPMSILRPCCASMTMAMTNGDCCTRPECCLEAGAVLGITMAFLAPIDRARGKRAFAERVLGTLLIAGSVLGVRCTGLFLGESLGLIGGLALGALVAGGVRTAFTRGATA